MSTPCDNIKSNPYLSANVSLFVDIQCQLTGSTKLKDDLPEVCKRSHQWKLTFNPDLNKQAVEIYFSSRRKLANV